jgi:signal transduction histidine kinase
MDTPSISKFWLPGIFGIVVLSFVAATGFVHWQMRVVDGTVLDVTDTAALSIEHLAAARGEMRHLQTLLREEADRSGRGEAVDRTAVAESRAALNRALDDYLALPVLPVERERGATVLREKDALDAAVRRFERETDQGDLDAARSTLHAVVPVAAANLTDAITRTIQTDAGQMHELALQIRALRTRSTYIAVGLDVVCTLIAIAGAIVLRRSLRAHADLVERHRRLHEERESALDDFAGRVAHDILGPLGTVAFALDLATRPGGEQRREQVLERGTAALERVKTLVAGLLEFARAGGKPVVTASADVESTIVDLVGELRPAAAEIGAELNAKHIGTCFVACSPGVLTSLIANLARNALKYLGDGPVRRIDIRALDRGGAIRLEVEDTGPGLAPSIEKHVFEPYVRSASATQPGVGLGLATVKRLAEAHGGRVGVHSTAGRGSTFWFEIPKAAG